MALGLRPDASVMEQSDAVTAGRVHAPVGLADWWRRFALRNTAVCIFDVVERSDNPVQRFFSIRRDRLRAEAVEILC